MGYVKSAHKNYYLEPYPETHYQGLHLNFISPYGQEFELQIHSQESFNAKQEGHEYYEIVRSVAASKEKKDECSEKMFAIHESVPKPKDYDTWPFKYAIDNKDRLIEERKLDTDIFIDRNKEDKSANSLVYSISLRGKKLLEGFENVYSDGSAHSYQNNIRDGFAKYCAVMKDGKEISTYQVEPKHYELEEVEAIAVKTEKEHKEYMATHFGKAQKEEFEETLEIAHFNTYGRNDN